MGCTKHMAKEKQQERTNLENQLKMLGKSLYKDAILSKCNSIDAN